MNLAEKINSVDFICRNNRINLPESAGVYAFWWLGSKEVLLNGNTHIILKGPKGINVDVQYKDWWPKENPYPCLYLSLIHI